MVDFKKLLEKEANYKQTENLAKTHASTLDPLLDFFSLGGALRNRSEEDIIRLFSRAYFTEPLLTLKALFYLRDVRGGQGERRTFRIILNWLGEQYPQMVQNNLKNIPYYGRWDDLYALLHTIEWNDAIKYIGDQLSDDLDNKNPSLLAKWLKSPNTSSKKSRVLAKYTYKSLGMKEPEYRKMLSKLRRQIKIVERYMCKNEWTSIEYDKVPSNASLKYRKAFKKHDPERYEEYLNQVEKGEKTIKAGTLYPYDIIRAVDKEGYNKTLELQWRDQPNWVEEGENSIVVCDTSGSMVGGRRNPEPIHVSVSLAMYFAERNKGPFENTFITFSSDPELQTIMGNTLSEKYGNLSRAHWEMNTNLQAVFDLILRTATNNKVPQEDMIKKIYIISDMEFDVACGNNRYNSYGEYIYASQGSQLTNFQEIARKYKEAGYEMPMLVFWNVDARQDQAPITKDERGVYLVSGCSPSIFRSLMASKTIGPMDLMMEVLNSSRYDRVVL